jgi:hypothetical protein
MTQQTTAERIYGIIREHLDFYAGQGEWAAAVEAGETIAAEIDALTRERVEARAEVERLRPAAWSQVFELQAKHAATWRDRDESYWLAGFMGEVGELAGALVGNHVGPVEWELSQLAAIALNWLDMRAARAQAAKEVSNA